MLIIQNVINAQGEITSLLIEDLFILKRDINLARENSMIIEKAGPKPQFTKLIKGKIIGVVDKNIVAGGKMYEAGSWYVEFE